MNATAAVEFSSVSRSFGPIHAVEELSFAVPSGSITVLLGPNGAGKTTTVRLTTGALAPDSGSIRVLGIDPQREGARVRLLCGVIPPKPAFYEQLTGRENLTFAAELFDAPQSALQEAARRFGIDYALDQEVSGYSTGMRTRLALARAVVHEPDILLLDEPTAGLDPEASRAVLGLIRELAARGRTILMCTHLLHEAEGVADQVILMKEGTALTSGHPSELAGRYMAHPVVIVDAEDRAALGDMTNREGVLEVKWNGAAHVMLDGMARLPGLVAALVAAGARLTRVEPVTPSLEELYFRMQRSHREDK